MCNEQDRLSLCWGMARIAGGQVVKLCGMPARIRLRVVSPVKIARKHFQTELYRLSIRHRNRGAENGRETFESAPIRHHVSGKNISADHRGPESRFRARKMRRGSHHS